MGDEQAAATVQEGLRPDLAVPSSVGVLLPNDHQTNYVNESALMPTWEVQGTSWKWQGIFWVLLSAEA